MNRMDLKTQVLSNVATSEPRRYPATASFWSDKGALSHS